MSKMKTFQNIFPKDGGVEQTLTMSNVSSVNTSTSTIIQYAQGPDGQYFIPGRSASTWYLVGPGTTLYMVGPHSTWFLVNSDSTWSMVGPASTLFLVGPASTWYLVGPVTTWFLIVADSTLLQVCPQYFIAGRFFQYITTVRSCLTTLLPVDLKFPVL